MGLSFCSLLEPATGLCRVKKLAAPNDPWSCNQELCWCTFQPTITNSKINCAWFALFGWGRCPAFTLSCWLLLASTCFQTCHRNYVTPPHCWSKMVKASKDGTHCLCIGPVWTWVAKCQNRTFKSNSFVWDGDCQKKAGHIGVQQPYI